MKKLLALILVLLIGITFYGCDQNTVVEDEYNGNIPEENPTDEEEVEEEEPLGYYDTALVIVDLLKDKDMEGLSEYVHPTKGVRFSPYAYINTKEDLVFQRDQVAGLLEDTNKYVWGHFDGSGEPITADFIGYYSQFIYDVDFAKPEEISDNKALGQGNSLNTLGEAYPEGSFVEFYFSGFDPQYTGMDWRTLRLVLEEYEGHWYLVGIVHDQWTI